MFSTRDRFTGVLVGAALLVLIVPLLDAGLIPVKADLYRTSNNPDENNRDFVTSVTTPSRTTANIHVEPESERLFTKVTPADTASFPTFRSEVLGVRASNQNCSEASVQYTFPLLEGDSVTVCVWTNQRDFGLLYGLRSDTATLPMESSKASTGGTEWIGSDLPYPPGHSHDTTTEVVEVPPETTRTVQVRSGDSLTNKLYDITAESASVHINASGSDWAIRNIGIKGQHPGGHYLINAGVPEGDTATIENVYMGNGQDTGTSGGGIVIDGDVHRGILNIRNVNIQHMIENGIHATTPGHRENGRSGGVVNVHNSYFNSNNVASLRLGSRDGRTSTIKNVVVEQGSTRPCGADCEHTSDTTPRGVWAWWGPVKVMNSDIDGEPARALNCDAGDSPEIVWENSRWGHAARTDRVPDGVPLTAKQAASGDSDGETSLHHTLSIETFDGGPVVRYDFTIDGDAEKGSNTEDHDTLSDSGSDRVRGEGLTSTGYSDSYNFQGSLESFEADKNEEHYRVLVDDEPIDVTGETVTTEPTYGSDTVGRTALALEFTDETDTLLGDTVSTIDIGDSFAYTLKYTLSKATTRKFHQQGFDTSPGSDDFDLIFSDTYGARAWPENDDVQATVRARENSDGIIVTVRSVRIDLPGALGVNTTEDDTGGLPGDPPDCLIESTGTTGMGLQKLRAIRDTILRTAPGRRVTEAYYRVSRWLLKPHEKQR